MSLKVIVKVRVGIIPTQKPEKKDFKMLSNKDEFFNIHETHVEQAPA